ncbi:putative transcription factor bHLH041 isoform X2 [Populus trichocarpa]|uniref:putative transcription factor bHLH041 isoform X2 n=1 Tax=Populus trichocarpa TaxID=3694 RepID=UPI000D18ADD5|nr:putative transcription factor bHLH041 isoform X2 [Populus trichocarpa]|eukprot:XP_024459254.1 putative transcription factor bHLH041 isoform X2 [Populus trichocarpa]
MMDAVFLLSEVERANFLRYFMQCFGSTYICLWSYLPQPSNYLFFWDGYYHEESNQPSSSSGSVARMLFDQYRQERFFAVNDRVPGVAFKNKIPFIELKEFELQRSASTDAQRRFYQTAVFMGCNSGEIELGWSNATHQFNIENEMRNWFPKDFSRQSPLRELPLVVDPNIPSSSSSSLRSLSMDSPEISSLIFTIPSSSHMPEAHREAPSLLPPILPSTSSPLQHTLQLLQPVLPTPTGNILQQVLQSLQQEPSPQQQAIQSSQSTPSTTSLLQEAMQPLQAIQSSTSPHQQALQAFALERNIQLPTPESEDAVMTRAILAVLTFPSPSSSSSSHSLPHMHRVRQGASAFNNYRSALAPKTQTRASLHRHSMLTRVITYYRRLNIERREHMLGGRPSSTQLHHMISERKRREKINESFKALRSILPPEAKKDKASILTRTREYLTSLKAQVEELTRKNQKLEAQLSKAAVSQVRDSSYERLDVRVTHISESTSEQRIIDLVVNLRGESPILDTVITRILEFLRQVTDVSLISIEASTHTAESTSFNRVILRLNIEGTDWDESGFQEAVKRVVEDLAR